MWNVYVSGFRRAAGEWGNPDDLCGLPPFPDPDPSVAAEAWEAVERLREEILGPLG